MTNNLTRKRLLILAATVILSVFLASAAFLELQPGSPENRKKTGGFGLIPPPAYATDYGDPIDTSNIGFMAYYFKATGFILEETAGAFLNYTDNGSYYDGYVRIYQEATGTSFDTYYYAQQYIDAQLRVRSDGWILAWISRSNWSYVNAPHWASRFYIATDGYLTPPAENYISPMRAIDRVFYVAGLSSPGAENMNIYDYGHPTATKLVMFGNSDSTPSSTIFYVYFSLFPSTENNAIVDSVVCIKTYQSSSGGNYQHFYVNGNNIYTQGAANSTVPISTFVLYLYNISSYLSLDSSALYESLYSNVNYGFHMTINIVWLN